jgi:hypothetical protein
MAEACQLYKEMLDQTRRNIHRAVLGMGPYQLAPGYEHAVTKVTEWQDITLAQKLKLKQFDSKVQISEVKGSVVRNTMTSTTTTSNNQLSPQIKGPLVITLTGYSAMILIFLHLILSGWCL